MKNRAFTVVLVLVAAALLAAAVVFVPRLVSGNQVARIYDEAMNDMQQGKYAEAADRLSGITFYMDSVNLSLYCRAHAYAAEGDYDSAVSELKKLGGFRDAQKAAAYFAARRAEENASTPGSRANAADLYDAEEINGYRDSSVRAAEIRSALYRDGLAAEDAEKWTEASAIFEALDSYEDSRVRCRYATGRVYEADSADNPISYAYAAVYYDQAGIYRDAADREKDSIANAYENADRMIRAEDFSGAKSIYVALDHLCDRDKFTRLEEAIRIAEENARLKRVAEADALLAQEKFDDAYTIYLGCGESGKAREALYLKAAWLGRNGSPESAAKVYMDIVNYKDSRDRHYLLGKERMDSDPETASRILLEDRTYPGAADDLYAIARAATTAGNYPLSISVYGEFAGERDCSLRMMNDMYLYGRQLLEGDDPDHAAEIFDRLKGVGSADLYANMARYASADAFEKKGMYKTAATAFDYIAGYADAADRADGCRYLLAAEKKKNGEYAEAAQIFDALGDREDSAEQAKDCRYLLAGQYADGKRWEDAIALYTELDEYAESHARLLECYRMLGWKQMDDGEAAKAYQSFVSADDADAQAQAAFAAGEACTAGLDLYQALTWYRLAPDLPETEERVAMIAESLLNMEEDSLSEDFASVALNSEKTQAVLYALALHSLENKDEEAAMRQMKKAGDNADASERFQEMLSAHVEALVAAEKFDDAIFLCSTYGDQEHADEIRALKAQKEEEERRKAQEAEQAAHEAKKQEANALLEAGQYEEAAAFYTELGETELAEKALAMKEETEKALRAEEEAARAEAEKAEREKIRAREEEAAALLTAGNYDEAIGIYQELNEPEMVCEAIYQKAAALGRPELYLEIPDYKDSRELHYLAGKALLDQDPEKAFRILSDDISYSDVRVILYDMADRESEQGNCLLSAAVFELLGAQPLDPRNPRPDCMMRSVQDMYRYGMQLRDQGDWETAAAIFDALSGIGGAREHSREAYYAIAGALEESGKYTQAAVAFEALDDYSDAGERAKRNRYSAAVKQLEAGAFDSAEAAFAELRGYSDSADMARECRYRKANSLFAAGDYEEAEEIFRALGDYADSAANRRECVRQAAGKLMESGDYPGAIRLYETISDHEDVPEKLAECHEAIAAQYVEKAELLLQKSETGRAAEAYSSAHDEYAKAGDTDRTDAMAMLVAECYQSVNDLNSALFWYGKAGEAGKPGITGIAEYAFQTEQYAAAESVALTAGTEEARSILYRIAEIRLAEGDEEAALRLFEEAGDYQDASGRREDTLVLRAEELIESGELSEAEAVADSLGGDAGKRLLYLIAGKQYDAGNDDEALRLYAAIGDYEDAEARHDGILYDRAVTCLLNGEYGAAIDSLDLIPDFRDAAEKRKEAVHGLALDPADGEDSGRVLEARMAYAEDMIAAGDLDSAIDMLRKMNRDQSVTDQLNAVLYQRAGQREDAGWYEEAIEDYEALGRYKDAEERIRQARYSQAMLCKEAADYDGAIGYLEMIPDYLDSRDQVMECTYLKAGKLAEEGDQAGAIAIYQGILDYRDVRDILYGDGAVRGGLDEWRASLAPGNVVHLGNLNGEEIEWVVLDRDGDYLFLIAKDVLEQYMYDDSTRVTWQHSKIRAYLNGEFMERVFSEKEAAAIRLTTVKAEKGTNSKGSPGNNTEDRIYLLNEQEIKKYKKTLQNHTASGVWWTRTPGTSNTQVFIVNTNRDTLKSTAANRKNVFIRPALWIDRSAIIH